MKTLRYDPFNYLDGFSKPRTFAIDTSLLTRKFQPNNNLKSIEKIYTYLNGGKTGLKDFLDAIKSEIGHSTNSDSGKIHWEFDKEEALKYFWGIDRFVPILDEQGLDDYDRLFYSATHPLQS